MKKVIVIGSPGAGKSTFSRRLSAATNLPLYYLDMIWHRADKTNISQQEFDIRLEEILKKEEWIIDGNYARTLKARILSCDTIFFLDYPVDLCLSGVYSRIGKPRVDMPWIETEPDEELIKIIRDFPLDQRPEIIKLLKEAKANKTVVSFESRSEAEEFIAKL